MARVQGLHRVAIRVPDVDVAARFYTELWGLREVGRTPAAVQLASQASDHADYWLVRGEDAPLDHLALAVSDQAALASLIEAASAAGGVLVDRSAPAGETCATLRDPDGNVLVLTVPEGGASVSSSRVEREGPVKLGHVVLWSPQIEAMEAFYGRLGFAVSDRTHIGMSFMRCNTDHHTLALVRHETRRGLQHVAFDVTSLDAVMRQLGRMRKAGVDCIWGPGRHGPGNNVFTYYQDPAGTVIECYGELEQVPADQESVDARFWGPEHGGDIWGLAGPPPAVFRGLPPSA